MKLEVSPTVRVTFGMLMLTISMIFVADWLGLIPRERQLEIEQRKRFSETLAVQLTSLARAGGREHIRATLTALVERDDTIESAALRVLADDSMIEVGNHAALWTLNEDDDQSTPSQIIVPIFRGDERWGSVEVRFQDPATVWYSIPTWDSLLTLFLFLIVCGFVLYFLFLRRVLRELDPRQVIPERVISAFNALAEGVLILDDEARVVLANTAFTDNASLQEQDLLGKPINSLNWSAYKHEPVLKPETYPWSKVMLGGTSLTGSRLTIHKDSQLERSYTVNCTPIKDGDDSVRGAIVTFDDLTEIERNNQQLSETLVELKQTQADITLKNMELQQLATKDPLTNCLNRRAFTERFRVLFDHAVEHQTELVCIMADIDHFKRINDNYGHGVGDKVIKFVADVLRRQLRKDDVLGRYGGEEFCIILDGLTLEQAQEVAERMRREIISGDPTVFTAALRVTASFGLASIHDEMVSSDELVNKADKALYLSKEGGRNKVTLWDEEAAESDNRAQARAAILSDAAAGAGAASMLLVGSQEDPSERIRKLEAIAEERAEQFDNFAAYDQATQLPVRGLFMDRIEQSLLRAGREKRMLAVLSLGVSNLKRVNDMLGHDAAQEFVRQASDRLKMALRDTDTVSLMSDADWESTISKLNDGEFGLLLPSVSDAESITWIVKRIFDVLQEPLYVDDHLLTIEGNAGIGIYPADGDDAITLLKNASISRYFAEQQTGHSNVEYFSEEINRVSRAQLRLESEMTLAIDHDQFRVVYQPKIDLTSGEITGFEALLRWDHPDKGLLTPNEFIDIAERTRLINLIGDWVLRQACLHINKLSEDCGRRLTLAVNFSPVQFSQDDLVDRVLQIIKETSTDAQLLELELTESCLVNNFESTLASLARLQQAGVNISIDDFGTGYSGLSALRNLPVNILKIDRSFIADVNTSDHDRAIVEAIVAMARALGLSVVAEGIENRAQLHVLTKMGCEEAQGYLFSRPVSIEKARDLLATTSSWIDPP